MPFLSVARRARRHLPALLLLAPAVASLGACTNLTDVNLTPNRYAAVNILAKNAPGAQARASATVVMFDALQPVLPNSALQQTDQCQYALVDTTTRVTRGIKKAGETVTIGVGGSSVIMPFDAGLSLYATPAGAPILYNAGDVAQVTIPGDAASYPAASISVKLAEPLVPGVVSVPTGTAPMSFTWNATNDTTAAIILSLRYANPATSTFANEQIYCALKDDGSHQLAQSVLAAFLASPANRRSLIMTRWRTREVLVDSRTALHIVSSVDTTVTIQP